MDGWSAGDLANASRSAMMGPGAVAQQDVQTYNSQRENARADQMQPYNIQQKKNEAQAAQIKAAADKLDFSMQTLQSVHDQQSLDAWHDSMQKNGIDTSGDPVQYDQNFDSWKNQSLQQATSVKDKLQLQMMGAYKAAMIGANYLGKTTDTDSAKAAMSAMGVSPMLSGGMVGQGALPQYPQMAQPSAVPPALPQTLAAPNSQDPNAQFQQALAQYQQTNGVSQGQNAQYAQLGAPQVGGLNVQTVKGMGGVMGIKAKQIMADNPGITVTDAYSLAQKIPEGMTVKDGQMVPFAGALASKSAGAFAEAQGKGKGEASTAYDKTMQTDLAAGDAKLYDGIQTNADAAVKEKTTYEDVMNHMNPSTWANGPLADIQMDAKRAYKAFAQLTGSPVDKNVEKGIVDQTTFSKAAIQLLRTATKELSSREAVQGMMIVGKSLPSTSMDEGAVQNIAARAMGMDDFMQAKATAADQWRAAHGNSLQGFDGDFRKNVVPDAFIFDYLPEDKQIELRDSILRQPNGAKMMQKIIQSRAYIKGSAGGQQ